MRRIRVCILTEFKITSEKIFCFPSDLLAPGLAFSISYSISVCQLSVFVEKALWSITSLRWSSRTRNTRIIYIYISYFLHDVNLMSPQISIHPSLPRVPVILNLTSNWVHEDYNNITANVIKEDLVYFNIKNKPNVSAKLISTIFKFSLMSVNL